MQPTTLFLSFRTYRINVTSGLDGNPTFGKPKSLNRKIIQKVLIFKYNTEI